MLSLHLDITQSDDINNGGCANTENLDPSATFDDYDFAATEEFGNDLDEMDDPFAAPKKPADPFSLRMDVDEDENGETQKQVDVPRQETEKQQTSLKGSLPLTSEKQASEDVQMEDCPIAQEDVSQEAKEEDRKCDESHGYQPSGAHLAVDEEEKHAPSDVLEPNKPVSKPHRIGDMRFDSESSESEDNEEDEELAMAKMIRRERKHRKKERELLASQQELNDQTSDHEENNQPDSNESVDAVPLEQEKKIDDGPKHNKAMADLFGKFKFGRTITTKKKSSPRKGGRKLKEKPVINLLKADPNLKIVFEDDENDKNKKRKRPSKASGQQIKEDLLANCNTVVKTRRAGFKKTLVKGVNMKRKKLQKKYRREFGTEEDYAANDFGRDEDDYDHSERVKRDGKQNGGHPSVVWDDDDDEGGLISQVAQRDADGDVGMEELELKLELDESQSMSNGHSKGGQEDSIDNNEEMDVDSNNPDDGGNGPETADGVEKPPERQVARDIEEIDLSELLKKDRSEWDEEDHALFNLMYGDRQAVPDEISKYFDIEASDEDEEGNPIPRSKEEEEFEKQFGVVKGLISMEKNVELASDKVDRDALYKQMMAQEDAEREAMIQRAFVDGEWRNMKRNNMLDDDDDFDAANPMTMLGRDAELGKRPEDFLCDDEELNKDCYDEYGNFLPVWQIKLNRYRRQVNSMNFLMSDEEDVGEEEIAKRKALAVKRKFRREITNSQVDEQDDFDDSQREFLRRMRSKRKKLVRAKSQSSSTSEPSASSASLKSSKTSNTNFASFNKSLPDPGLSALPKSRGPPLLHSQSSFSAMFGDECRKLNEEGFSNHDSQASSSFSSKRFVFAVDQSRSRQAAPQRRVLKRSSTEPGQGGRHAKRRRLND